MVADSGRVSAVPQLQRLARSRSGDAEALLEQELLLACEQLDMGVAVVGRIAGGSHAVDFAVRAGAGRDRSLEGSRPVEESYCAHVREHAPLIVPDVRADLRFVDLDVTRMLKVGCYTGITLRKDPGAETAEVLGLLGHHPDQRMDGRDIAVLRGLGEVIAERYVAWREAAGGSGTAGTEGPTADDLQGLTRPLLDALQELTGVASTFLTSVDEVGDQQQLLLAHNSKESLSLPEGAVIPWHESMCWLALHHDEPAVHDLPARWPDAMAARAFGLVTLISVPVELSDGSLWGTLCATDDVAHLDAADHVPKLRLFARLIAADVERAKAVAEQRAQSRRAQQLAETDELTGCYNRRRVKPWLAAALDVVAPGEVVVLAFVDVNRFKDVNDQYGHASGDAVLRTLGRRLREVARPADLAARLGGDEFLIAAAVPRPAVDEFEHRIRAAAGFDLPTALGELAVRCSVGVATSDDVAGPDALIELSDARMYRSKFGAAAR
jgi:diguanylate cyclase (GGDEF)-like protein